jgi:membrane protease YdiL (CAAX protease family)
MIATAADWARLMLGLSAVFALFHWSASALGSDRGQHGLLIGGLVIAATMVVERLGFGSSWRHACRALGLGRPRAIGLATAVAISTALVLVVPAYAWSTGTRFDVVDDWPMLVPGLFAQAGVAEESLFRGWLYGHVRRGRTFRRAATLSVFPFAAVHLVLFLTLPAPIAAASLALSIVTSFPFAWLYEIGGGTMWGAAVLHATVQGTVKLVAPEVPTALFPVTWMAASAVVPLLAFAVRPRATTE